MRQHTGLSVVSCGVIVTDGVRLLLGHASRSPRWDIPKGIAEADETLLQAAVRELAEETGLAAEPAALEPLGLHDYRAGKRLALFVWRPRPLPDPAGLVCRSTFTTKDGHVVAEFDRFGLFDWNWAEGHVGRDMARLLRWARTVQAKAAATPP